MAVVFLAFVLLPLGFVWVLVGTETGSRFLVGRALSLLAESSPCTVGEVRGTLLKHVAIRDIQIKGKPCNRLPHGFVLRVSKVDVYFSVPWLTGLNVEVYNGRLLLPYGGVIMVYGMYQDQVFEGDVFASGVRVGDIRRISGDDRLFQDVDGIVSRLECRLKGGLSGLEARGKGFLSQFSGKNFNIRDCPVGFQVKAEKAGAVTGSVDIYSGKLSLPKSRMEIKTGNVYLEKDIQSSRMNLRASSVVEKTKIDIVLKGTFREPALRLTSDPPRSQERLILMLLTGKSWQSTQEALGKGELSMDVVRDALSFLFFGSGPEGLAQKLGISDIHLVYNGQKRGVEVETTILPKTRVTYGVEQEQAETAGPQEPVKQKVGVIYDVGEYLSVEGRGDVGGYDESVTNSETQPDDQAVYLKYKKRF